MKRTFYLASAVCVVLLFACGGGGGVKINPATVDSSTFNSVTDPISNALEENLCGTQLVF